MAEVVWKKREAKQRRENHSNAERVQETRCPARRPKSRTCGEEDYRGNVASPLNWIGTARQIKRGRVGSLPAHNDRSSTDHRAEYGHLRGRRCEILIRRHRSGSPATPPPAHHRDVAGGNVAAPVLRKSGCETLRKIAQYAHRAERHRAALHRFWHRQQQAATPTVPSPQ
ncbi:hypothetical protein KCP75_24095 [Salmonella enterica subsp. enterica]|nr:hypothetical protein KCP75_24095 [Salmonella enterica subsp. enterica]